MKIAAIGGGALGFTRGFVRDVLSVPELQKDTEVVLHDIDPVTLDHTVQVVRKEMEANGLNPRRLTGTLNRRQALKNAKYIFCAVRIGGLSSFEQDVEIPLKYGVDQCVGDTLCAGGIMYAQRTIPALLDFCRDIAEVGAPDALLLSHSNPMAMNTWACVHHGYGVRTVGLCHGVQGTAEQIAEVLGARRKELDYIAAGVNHQTWFLKVLLHGRDIPPSEILKRLEAHPIHSKMEYVRIEMLRRFGYYTTETSGHYSEYVPWFRSQPDYLQSWVDPRAWTSGQTGGCLDGTLGTRNWMTANYADWLKTVTPLSYKAEERGFETDTWYEHGGYIVEALETGHGYRGHFNVLNNNCITNLPADAIVEVPCYVDRLGIHTPHIGALPTGPAAVCNASISVQRLSAEAAVHGDDEMLRQAMLMDPLVGAVCNPPEVWQMVDDFLIAQARWLPQFKKAVAAAKKRQAKGPRLPTPRATAGVHRAKVATVQQMREGYLREQAQKQRDGEEQALATDHAQLARKQATAKAMRTRTRS